MTSPILTYTHCNSEIWGTDAKPVLRSRDTVVFIIDKHIYTFANARYCKSVLKHQLLPVELNLVDSSNCTHSSVNVLFAGGKSVLGKPECARGVD